ncbi:nucleotidyl transferase AbiEii/AbiGii toxin family protein [Roseateles chitinivorans]|uniref:nucleotidyl transferase AbiEii/AbiGii toxin family protein n=1 Tax=Roseateles chitinivorans TaxID=2917965 RepID=UPI003D66D9D9
MSRNVAASVRDRLLNLAQRTDINFSRLITRFGLERFLYRLSASPHANEFLLKGALLFSLWYQDRNRPTRDADFVALTSNDVERLVAVFKTVCAVQVDDGVSFDPDSVVGRVLGIEEKYVVRVTLTGELNRARLSIQLDIGYGDAVSPGPQPIVYPTLLPDLPAPRLMAYRKETAIAEKLHAIWARGIDNTRLKDYFDLDVLLHDDLIDPHELRTAIGATFAQRGTALPDGVPEGLSREFSTHPIRVSMWKSFLKKNNLTGAELPVLVERMVVALRRLEVI